MAISRGLGAIGEDMPQMRIAARTKNLDPHHSVASISMRLHIFGRNRLKETRPAAHGVELVGGGE